MGHESQTEPWLTPNEHVPLCWFQNRLASSRRSNENRWSRNPETETFRTDSAPFSELRSRKNSSRSGGVFSYFWPSSAGPTRPQRYHVVPFTNYRLYRSGQISRGRNCHDGDEDGAKDESSGPGWDCRLLLAIYWTRVLCKKEFPMDATRSRHELIYRSADSRVLAPPSTAGRSLAVSVASDRGQRVWVRLGDKPRLCPKCRSAATLPSHRRGILETFLLTFLPARPFRCMDCNRHFYGWTVNSRSIRSWFPSTRQLR
jgi:hypothetical protein